MTMDARHEQAAKRASAAQESIELALQRLNAGDRLDAIDYLNCAVGHLRKSYALSFPPGTVQDSAPASLVAQAFAFADEFCRSEIELACRSVWKDQKLWYLTRSLVDEGSDEDTERVAKAIAFLDARGSRAVGAVLVRDSSDPDRVRFEEASS